MRKNQKADRRRPDFIVTMIEGVSFYGTFGTFSGEGKPLGGVGQPARKT